MAENNENTEFKHTPVIETPEEHRKNRRVLIWVLLIFFVLLAILILRCCFCKKCNKKIETAPTEQVVEPAPQEVKDTTPKVEEKPVFSLDKLTPANLPLGDKGFDASPTTTKTFEDLLNAQIEAAKANNASTLNIPQPGILFEQGKDTFNEMGAALITAYAKAFTSTNMNAQVEIAGYASQEGKPEANMQLSNNRANRVKNALVAAGVPEEKVITKAYGEEQYNKLDGVRGLQENRRVNIRIIE